jgi:hypothetical protein
VGWLKQATTIGDACSAPAGFVITLLFYAASSLYLALKKRRGVKIQVVILMLWTYLVLSGNSFIKENLPNKFEGLGQKLSDAFFGALNKLGSFA